MIGLKEKEVTMVVRARIRGLVISPHDILLTGKSSWAICKDTGWYQVNDTNYKKPTINTSSNYLTLVQPQRYNSPRCLEMVHIVPHDACNTPFSLKWGNSHDESSCCNNNRRRPSKQKVNTVVHFAYQVEAWPNNIHWIVPISIHIHALYHHVIYTHNGQ